MGGLDSGPEGSLAYLMETRMSAPVRRGAGRDLVGKSRHTCSGDSEDPLKRETCFWSLQSLKGNLVRNGHGKVCEVTSVCHSQNP